MSTQDLDKALLLAHQNGDRAGLISLYAQAADDREEMGDIDAACFYLTHAFVFALQEGAPEQDELNRRLWEYGREERLPGSSETKS